MAGGRNRRHTALDRVSGESADPLDFISGDNPQDDETPPPLQPETDGEDPLDVIDQPSSSPAPNFPVQTPARSSRNSAAGRNTQSGTRQSRPTPAPRDSASRMKRNSTSVSRSAAAAKKRKTSAIVKNEGTDEEQEEEGLALVDGPGDGSPHARKRSRTSSARSSALSRTATPQRSVRRSNFSESVDEADEESSRPAPMSAKRRAATRRVKSEEEEEAEDVGPPEGQQEVKDEPQEMGEEDPHARDDEDAPDGNDDEGEDVSGVVAPDVLPADEEVEESSATASATHPSGPTVESPSSPAAVHVEQLNNSPGPAPLSPARPEGSNTVSDAPSAPKGDDGRTSPHTDGSQTEGPRAGQESEEEVEETESAEAPSGEGSGVDLSSGIVSAEPRKDSQTASTEEEEEQQAAVDGADEGLADTAGPAHLPPEANPEDIIGSAFSAQVVDAPVPATEGSPIAATKAEEQALEVKVVGEENDAGIARPDAVEEDAVEDAGAATSAALDITNIAGLNQVVSDSEVLVAPGSHLSTPLSSAPCRPLLPQIPTASADRSTIPALGLSSSLSTIPDEQSGLPDRSALPGPTSNAAEEAEDVEMAPAPPAAPSPVLAAAEEGEEELDPDDLAEPEEADAEAEEDNTKPARPEPESVSEPGPSNANEKREESLQDSIIAIPRPLLPQTPAELPAEPPVELNSKGLPKGKPGRKPGWKAAQAEFAAILAAVGPVMPARGAKKVVTVPPVAPPKPAKLAAVPKKETKAEGSKSVKGESGKAGKGTEGKKEKSADVKKGETKAAAAKKGKVEALKSAARGRSDSTSSMSETPEPSQSSKTTKSTTSHEAKIIAEDEDDEEDDPVYCNCGKLTRSDGNDTLVGCDGCDNWFHAGCVGMTDDDIDLIDTFFCSSCEKTTGHKTTMKRICKREGCDKIFTPKQSKFCSDSCAYRHSKTILAGLTNKKHITALSDALSNFPPPPLDIRIIEHSSSLSTIPIIPPPNPLDVLRQRVQATQAQVDILGKRQKILKLAVECCDTLPPLNVGGADDGKKKRKPGGGEDRPCGWVPALIWNDEEVAGWEEGMEIMVPVPEARRANGEDVEMNNGEEQEQEQERQEVDLGYCSNPRKRCDRHSGWQKTIPFSLERELKQTNDALKIVTTERDGLAASRENKAAGKIVRENLHEILALKMAKKVV